MSEPSTYVDPLHGISGEIISAMSALNMEPEPLPQPNGIFLSETDKWASHAMEHLREAMNQQRKAEGKIYALQARLAQCEGERDQEAHGRKLYSDELCRAKNRICREAGIDPERGYEAGIAALKAERDAALERVRVLEADLTEDLQERDIVQPCSKCAELEAAVKAVQKVDGTLSVHHSAGHYVVLAAYTSGSKVCMGRFRSKEEADAYAALLALRAGMR